jgi:hypothetical protein
MKMTRASVGIAAIGVAALAFGSYSYFQRQTSLKRGIAETEHSLQQVNQLIEENQTEILTLLSSLATDVGTGLERTGSAGSDPMAPGNPPGDIVDSGGIAISLSGVVDHFRQSSSNFDASKAVENHDYGPALEQAAQGIASIWGKTNPWVAGGKEAIDIAANAYEANALLVQQARLMQAQGTLEAQLSRLRFNDPGNRAEWQRILDNLRTNSASEHDTFLKWLAANGLSERDAFAKALSNAANASPAIASQVASGTILDPSQLGNDLGDIPNINPDFIAAIQCDRYVATHAMSDPRWLKFTCAHYPDGTFIPAFGPCRGIDVPNPFYGGLISSSTAACASQANSSQSVAKTPIAVEALRNSLLAAAKEATHEYESAREKLENDMFHWNCSYHVTGVELADDPVAGSGAIIPPERPPSKDYQISGFVTYHSTRSNPDSSCNKLPGGCHETVRFLYDGEQWRMKWGGP